MKAAALALAVTLLAATPARAFDEAHRMLDASADVLDPQHGQWGVFWARYTRGFSHGWQLETHVAGDAVGVVNAFAKWRFLDRDELRASVELGFVWVATVELLPDTGRPLVLFVPAEVHATVPLADDLELDLALAGRASVTSGAGEFLGISTLDGRLALVRPDAGGAWLLKVSVPLVSRADVAADALLGKSNVARAITLADLDGWSVVGERDIASATGAHVRLGLGWRATPGLLLYESIGHVVLALDLYFR